MIDLLGQSLCVVKLVSIHRWWTVVKDGIYSSTFLGTGGGRVVPKKAEEMKPILYPSQTIGESAVDSWHGQEFGKKFNVDSTNLKKNRPILPSPPLIAV